MLAVESRVDDRVKKETAHIKAAVIEAYEPDPPPMTTESRDSVKKRKEDPNRPAFQPQVATDKRTLELSHHPQLTAFADYSQWNRVFTTELPLLGRGIIHSRFDMCESGRTRTSPNTQNSRRTGMRREDGSYGPCFRECLVPRDGCVFLVADYPSLEVHTLAEAMAADGLTDLADRIVEGYANGTPFDAHANLASVRMGISYEEIMVRLSQGDPEAKEVRRTSKPATFGFPVDMSPKTFVVYCANQGTKITLQEAEELKESWKRTYPENVEFLRRLSNRKSYSTGKLSHRIYGSGIWQGSTYYTAAANARFQGPGAYVGWKSIQLLTEECYIKKRSALFGSRPVMFVHDEFVTETPRPVFREAANRYADILTAGAILALPTVGHCLRPGVEVAEFYSKRIEAMHDPETGALLAWPSGSGP